MADSELKEPVANGPDQEQAARSELRSNLQSVKPASSITARVLGMFPNWVADNLRSIRSWKTLVRCWVATWAAFVIILPLRSLTTLGNVAFFGLLGALMMPPNMPVQMFVFVISLIILGQLLGWAMGAATMKAAVAARDVVLLRSTYQTAEQTAATAANPDIAFSLEIFQGVFLDVRSSVVFGVMFGVFCFMLALGRAYRPRLVLFFTFAQIFLDIFCTFGPLFPNTQYLILSSMLISIATYMAIGIVCCILIFPETMNHSYLVVVTRLLGDLRNYGLLYGTVLELSPDELTDDPNGIVDRCAKQRTGLILTLRDLQQKSGLINAEFSFGRWSGSDAKLALEEPLAALVSRMGCFYAFPKLLGGTSSRSLSRSTSKSEESQNEAGAIDVSSREEIAGDTEIIRQLNSRRYALEAKNNVRMADIQPILFSSTQELRDVCVDALGAAQNLLQQTNSGRWTRGSQALSEREADLDKAIERLRACAEAYRTNDRLAILEPFLALLHAADDDPRLREQLPLRPLVIASAFSAQLVVSIDGLVDLLDLIQRTAHKRRKARLWAPSSLRALGNFILRREKGSTMERALGENTVRELEEAERENELSSRRDPDSKAPTNSVQKLMNGVHEVYKWTKSPQAMFATKYAILSVLLWLPSVIRSSAHFYYVEKGVWALIMAQTSINVYVSDSIYSMVTRSIGTFLGLIFGLLVWYIGDGSGNGNSYGIAASFGVLVIPVLFVRINAPPTLLQPVIMFNATLALIVGYGWIDAKLALVGNPGVGWSIAWRRFVLVIIGVSAGAILMFIPPVSGRKAVRLQNAAIINELSYLYSTLMSVWIAEDEDPGSDTATQANEIDREAKAASSIVTGVKPAWAIAFRKRVLALVDQLHSMQAQTAMARFEGNMRGAWPAEEYRKLLEHEADMVAALGQLSSALQHLDPSWRASLNRRTMILNPDFITDVMSTFALVSQALRTGEPMHQILPSYLLDRLLYHHNHDLLSRSDRAPLENVSYVERASSLEFIFFSTAITAVSQIIRSLDEMHRITRSLCGEVPFRGFKEWKNNYNTTFQSV